jgi:hypothetical protein
MYTCNMVCHFQPAPTSRIQSGKGRCARAKREKLMCASWATRWGQETKKERPKKWEKTMRLELAYPASHSAPGRATPHRRLQLLQHGSETIFCLEGHHQRIKHPLTRLVRRHCHKALLPLQAGAHILPARVSGHARFQQQGLMHTHNKYC